MVDEVRLATKERRKHLEHSLQKFEDYLHGCFLQGLIGDAEAGASSDTVQSMVRQEGDRRPDRVEAELIRRSRQLEAAAVDRRAQLSAKLVVSLAAVREQRIDIPPVAEARLRSLVQEGDLGVAEETLASLGRATEAGAVNLDEIIPSTTAVAWARAVPGRLAVTG